MRYRNARTEIYSNTYKIARLAGYRSPQLCRLTYFTYKVVAESKINNQGLLVESEHNSTKYRGGAFRTVPSNEKLCKIMQNPG